MRVANLLAFLYLAPAVAFASVGSWAGGQTVLHQGPPTGESHGVELSSVPSNQFAVLSHSAFPGRSVRIKKSDFCDGTVNSYTGYIDVGARHMFFYFFESRSDPDKDDVLLWTNGGPGGSSATGLFMELGPCSIVTGNSTKFNPYSWNTNANIFFIDQPVGTGFSYADFGEVVVSTEEAAKDVAAFVATFFESFPKFKGRAFHLTGESYAGRYLPVYATAVYDQNTVLEEMGMAPVNLKSVLIGNGVTDFFEVLYSYYDITCTGASIQPIQSITNCVRMKQALPRCKKWIQNSCVDSLDLMDCGAAFQFCSTELSAPYRFLGRNPYDMTMSCPPGSYECYKEQTLIQDYLNQPWVRSQLGVSTSFGNFSGIARDVNTAFWASGDPYHLNQLYVSELLAHGVRVLIYAGTYDWIANWIGNERWTLSMDWEGREGFAAQSLKDWKVSGDAKPAGKFRTFGNFSFATIYGAGHLVPHDKPLESLTMLQRWIAEEDFA